MKRLLLINLLIFGFTFAGLSQERTFNLPLKFLVNESSIISLGNNYDGAFQDIKSQIKMEFDGKMFNIYTNGKVYSKTKVISYQRKVNKNYGKVKSIAYILKIAKDGFIQYIIIVKEFDMDAEIITVKIPYLSVLGETNGYNYYRKISLR